jgi:hypothetical protein
VSNSARLEIAEKLKPDGKNSRNQKQENSKFERQMKCKMQKSSLQLTP